MTARRLLAIVTLALGAFAIVVGVLLVASPDGSFVGLSPAALDAIPFRSLTLPGLFLAAAIGGTMVATGLAARRGSPGTALLGLGSGLLLIAWVSVQMALGGVAHPAQPILFVLGVVVVVLSVIVARAKRTPHA